MKRQAASYRLHMVVLGWALLTLTTVAEAATYYVATTGSDGNPGTLTAPFRTLGQGVSVLRPGDTLYVRAGTYTASSQLQSIPSGSSWAVPVTIAAYPGETPVLVAESDWQVIWLDTGTSYIVIDGFMMDATGGWDGIKIEKDTHHIRIQNSEIKYAPCNGILVSGNEHEFINVKVHENGMSCPGGELGLHHGIYAGTQRTLIERSEFYRNGGWGVHVYHTFGGVDGNIVRNNRIYDNGQSGRGPGMILSSGNGNIAYNNILWGNRRGGIQIDYGVTNAQVYNNTVYGNDGFGGVYIGQYSSGADVRNNIVHNNSGGVLTDDGVNTTLSNNLTTNPHVINAVAGDFRLQADSPAIDAGLVLPAVPTDIEGISRPQGSGYDLGAYEFGGTGASSATLTVSAVSVAPGETLTATWSGVSSPTVTDWLGVYSRGATDQTFTAWVYTSSCSTTAGTTAKANGSCPLTVPTTTGTYELRLFATDGYARLATSPPINVTTAALPGDLNNDGKRDLADVRLLIYMLLGQQPKTPEADLTGDGAVTLADVQALIRLIVGSP